MRFVLCLLFLFPCVVEAKKKTKKYSIIYRVKKLDGTMEYGIEERNNSKTEDNDEIKKQKELIEKYADAMRDYNEDFATFQKTKDGLPPIKPSKPDFTYEFKRYSGSREIKEMKKRLEKKNKHAKKYNEARAVERDKERERERKKAEIRKKGSKE